MAYIEDKILNGGEITKQGEFKGVSAFYLMLVPKSETAASVAILNVKLSKGIDKVDFPFATGTWNPVVVNSVDVKEEDLTNYRIFYGIE